jgi:hypothetical protein
MRSDTISSTPSEAQYAGLPFVRQRHYSSTGSMWLVYEVARGAAEQGDEADEASQDWSLAAYPQC